MAIKWLQNLRTKFRDFMLELTHPVDPKSIERWEALKEWDKQWYERTSGKIQLHQERLQP